MIEILSFLSVGLTAVSLVALAVLLRKDPSSKLVVVENRFVTIEKGLDRAERAIHDEVALNRSEFGSSMKSFTDSILSRLFEIGGSQKNQLDIFASQIGELTHTNDEKLDKIRDTMHEGICALQTESNELEAKQGRNLQFIKWTAGLVVIADDGSL